MKKTIFFIAFLLLTNTLINATEIDSLLQILEQTMDQQHTFDNAKELKITGIKQYLADPNNTIEENYHLYNQVYTEYQKYNFDSALLYTEKKIALAEQLNNIAFITESNIHLSGLLASSGRYKEAFDILEKITISKLPDYIHVKFYTVISEAYASLSYHTTLVKNTKKYQKLSVIYADSLFQISEPNKEKSLELLEKKLLDEGHLMRCKKINTRRLSMADMGTREYSIITYNRSEIYRTELDIEQQKKYLILSAISDIKTSIKDNASLSNLALILYNEGNVDKAYKYINFAMEDALFFNSSMRFISISNILPLITDEYQQRSDKQKANLKRLLKTISILVFILILALLYIYKQVRNLAIARNDLKNVNKQLKILNTELSNANLKLNDMNRDLSESNHIKEQYIGNFLKICSNYIDKLNSYRKMVNKRIAERKVTELFELTKSKVIIDNEIKEFYDNFDNTFLSIYPNFVNELNALLIPEERIELKKDELLNTELRIFALIRLGIVDSSKIAKLLRYSVNTIYNYRVKIKNKAAGNRDNFEREISKIGLS